MKRKYPFKKYWRYLWCPSCGKSFDFEYVVQPRFRELKVCDCGGYTFFGGIYDDDDWISIVEEKEE
jgi:hypothetical protein